MSFQKPILSGPNCAEFVDVDFASQETEKLSGEFNGIFTFLLVSLSRFSTTLSRFAQCGDRMPLQSAVLLQDRVGDCFAGKAFTHSRSKLAWLLHNSFRSLIDIERTHL
jgi:hypothetical protein